MILLLAGSSSRGLAGRVEVRFEGVEPLFPESAVIGNPHGGLLDGSRHEAAMAHTPFLFAAQQAGFLENAQVPGDGRERHVEGAGQLRDAHPPVRQALQDRPAGGIRKRREDRVE